jgi:hypothetical protein|uniref:Uncharacterized protein n=1 Tax=viral metagenome TaxID=1070528 RepID=A0A6C0BX38_9ZZZZ
MQDKLLVSVVISVFFVLCKFIDVRFIQKQPSAPPKHLAKDAVYTFMSSLCGLYIVEYIGGMSAIGTKQTGAFLDEPNF